MTSNSRTARCGPACRVVWQGRSRQAAPYADLREESDLSLEVVLDDFLHAPGAERELPVRAHHVDAEQFAGIDHVLPAGPQRGRRALPGVATIEQQRVRARGAHLLDQRGQVREATDEAVGLRGAVEIEKRECVGLRGARRNAEVLEQGLTDKVGRLAIGTTDTQIHARLAKMNRLQLRVAIGEVHEADVAEAGHGVHALGRTGLCREHAGWSSAMPPADATASICRKSRRPILTGMPLDG